MRLIRQITLVGDELGAQRNAEGETGGEVFGYRCRHRELGQRREQGEAVAHGGPSFGNVTPPGAPPVKSRCNFGRLLIDASFAPTSESQKLMHSGDMADRNGLFTGQYESTLEK